MKKIIILLMIMMIGTASYAVLPSVAAPVQSDTTVVVDLKELDSQTADSILKKMKEKEKKDVVQQLNPTSIREWKETALGLGMAVKELCKALNVEINAFLKTDAGKLLTFILVWKLFGATMLSFLIKLIVWGSFILLSIISFRYFHMRKRIKNEKGVIEYIDRYDWRSDEAKTFSVGLHLGIVIISALIITFAI